MMNNIDFVLAQAISIHTSIMRDDCIISRVPKVDDDAGSQAAGTPVIVAIVKCLITPLPKPVVIQAYNDKLGSFAKWRVELPLNTNPLEGDLLTINGQNMIVQIVLSLQTFSTNDEVLAAEIN